MGPRRTVLALSSRGRSVASMDTISNQIEDDARAEIAGDPRVPYPAEIAVEVVDGVATLRGTVGSFAQRHAAVADGRRTSGVEYVDDWLQVRLLDRDRREDAEIRGAALQRLESRACTASPASPTRSGSTSRGDPALRRHSGAALPTRRRRARRASARRRITAGDAGSGLTVQPTNQGRHRVQ